MTRESERESESDRRGKSHSKSDSPSSASGTTVYDELVRTAHELRPDEDVPLDHDRDRLDTSYLLEVVRHGPVLEALLGEPLDRREIEDRLGVSRATSHRLTRWLDDHELVEKRESRLHLTGKGQTLAESVLRFEQTVATADRLAPLLDLICDDHQDLVVEPFADATVTVASPDDPYRPIRRFRSLVEESETFRGFNTTHVVPLTMGEFFEALFESTETEVIYRPAVVETLFESFPERARTAVERGQFRVRTREALPYCLVLFDDCVGIGGYDETTGAMEVFVDTDAAYAREWAERTYETYRAHSDPLDAEGV
ncbi:helix-turn-helix transcriptional regulator [Halorussus halophilus]|uniref:helix-turn-helix transcriptional regulator n=1 Tax=Halorussus halophilus TaxID=2650975 RepID=UPI001CE496AE|nr:MarR family transcriptional regulator [Halorussus halophilus]